jgi:hypothetical protein
LINAAMQFLGPSDAPGVLRLAMLDAGTYDAGTKKGGVSAAVILRQVKQNYTLQTY